MGTPYGLLNNSEIICEIYLSSVHKIFPKDMSVFKCVYPGCSFTSGNQILFNRHVHKPKKVPSIMIRFKFTWPKGRVKKKE